MRMHSVALEIPMDLTASNPLSGNASRRVWTERDDDLPAFMAEMLASMIMAEMLETTKVYWQTSGDVRPRRTCYAAPRGGHA